MKTEKYTDLHFEIIDSLSDFCMLADDMEIYIDGDGFFEILKNGPLLFSHYFDENEWGDELYFAYSDLWELVYELYEQWEFEDKDEEEIDEFIEEILLEQGLM